jgi:hypothetical protein
MFADRRQLRNNMKSIFPVSVISLALFLGELGVLPFSRIKAAETSADKTTNANGFTLACMRGKLVGG